MEFRVQLHMSLWERYENGHWRFREDAGAEVGGIFMKKLTTYIDLVDIVRKMCGTDETIGVALTRYLPDSKLTASDRLNQPVNIMCDSDVALFMVIRKEHSDLGMGVTVGDDKVELYNNYRTWQNTSGSYSGSNFVSALNVDLSSNTSRGIDESMRLWEGEYANSGVVPASQAVLEEILTEDEMVVFQLISRDFAERFAMLVRQCGSAGLGSSSTNSPASQEINKISDGNADDIENLVGSVGQQTRGLNTNSCVVRRLDVGSPSSEGFGDTKCTVASARQAICVLDKGKGKAVEETVPVEEPSPSDPFLGLTIGCGFNQIPSPPLEISSGDDISDDSMGDEFVVNDTDDLYEGMIFPNCEAFKLHMVVYATRHKFHFRSPRSSPNMTTQTYVGVNCPWRIYATKMPETKWYQIKRASTSHLCTANERGNYQRQATSSLIGDMIRRRYREPGSGPRPNDVRELMRDEHDVRISYWKAWKSREIAMEIGGELSGSSYNMLPTYLQQLVISNPDSVVALETTYDELIGERFKYAFFALGASIKGFAYMRKAVIVDGAHLKGKYRGCLLTANAQDGNYQVFPLAFAIVDGENDLSWQWFFQKLSGFVTDNKDMIFISDRHPSIYSALHKVYPRSGHCACIVHLQQNIRTNFKTKNLGYLVSKAARAYRVSDFYSYFNEIKNANIACADYLYQLGFQHWARYHFEGERYNIITSNATVNAALRGARELPVVPLVEYIWSTLMGWFSSRRDESGNAVATLTPKVQGILTTNFEASFGFGIRPVNQHEFEVQDKDGLTFLVNLLKRACTCCEFQKIMIPCKHVVSVAIYVKVRVDYLVAVEYTTDYWKSAYAGSIYPVSELGQCLR